MTRRARILLNIANRHPLYVITGLKRGRTVFTSVLRPEVTIELKTDGSLWARGMDDFLPESPPWCKSGPGRKIYANQDGHFYRALAELLGLMV